MQFDGAAQYGRIGPTTGTEPARFRSVPPPFATPTEKDPDEQNGSIVVIEIE